MSRRIIAAILASLFCWLIAAPVFAIGEDMNVVHGTPVIDGEMDSVWRKADRKKIGYLTGGTEKKAGASAAFVHVLWDEEALYFLFEIVDDDFTFGAEPGSPLNDCIYLYIDEVNAFGPTWQMGQTQVALTPALGLSQYPRQGTGPKEYEMAFSWTEEGHALIEFKFVPQFLDLSSADEVLMDFQYNDPTPDGELKYRYGWSDELGECEDTSASWSFVRLRRSGASSEFGYETYEEAAEAISRTPVTDYFLVDGTEGYGGEGWWNLWDNDVTTKFCTGTFSMKSVVRLRRQMIIDGVIMATANDNDPYNGRSPDEWKIQGSLNGSDWEDIITGDESFFQEVNFTYFAVSFEDKGPYRYIRFYNKSARSGVCQLSECLVCSTSDEIKQAALIVEEPVVVDKATLVNYESMTRASKNAPAEEPEPTAPAPAAQPGNTPSPAKSASPVPGIAAAAVFLVLAVAGALILPKKLNE